MNQPSQPNTMPATAAPEGDGLAVAGVRDLLALLGKAVRAHQMYQANNPVYQRFIETLRTSFEALWSTVTRLEFSVEETGFVRDGETFVVGEGRDNLAFQFYKDGVRHVRFLAGFEDEVETFLAVIARARQLGPEEDDLVTLLWEQDFESFQYGYVDVLAEGLEPPQAPEPQLEPISVDLLRTDATTGGDDGGEEAVATAEAAAAAAPQTLSRDDFNQTLYFLDPDEFEALRVELAEEWSREPKIEVLNALFDRLEDPEPERQTEILGILRQLLPAFLGRGDMVSAAKVVQELEAIRARDDVLGADQRSEAENLILTLSEPVVLNQLIRSLEDGGIEPRSGELALFLSLLNAGALPVLVRAMESTDSDEVRNRLRPACDALAERHPELVVELLASDDDVVAAGAARVAGRLRLANAVPAVVRLAARADAATRIAAVHALAAIRSGPALDGLVRALDDRDRDVRIAAARGLGSLRYAPARAQFERIVTGRPIREADLTEKLAMFEAYADVAGVDAVSVLDRMLNEKGMLGRRPPTEMRACAATALGRIATPAARECLSRAREDADTIVRGAVSRALRREVAAS